MAATNDDLLISISADLTAVKRQLKQLGQDVGTATSGITKQFDGMGKSIDASMTPVQKRINDMLGIPFTSKTKEWKGALADVGKASVDMTQGFKLSRAGMMEMQAAGVNAFQALASGMSAVRVAQMEGAQVIGALIQGTEGGLKGLGDGVVGLVTKFPYVTAAVALAGAAFVAYEMIGGKSVATVDDALTEHAKTIKAVREAYGIAGDGADDYARRSIAAIESAQRRAEAALRESVAAAEKAAKSGLSDSGGFSGFGLLQQMGLLGDNDLNAVKAKFAAFAEPIKKLREEIAAGKPDFDAFQQSLDSIASTNPNLRPIADEISGIIDPAARGREALDNMSVALDGLSQAQIDTSHIVAQIYNIEAAAFAANAETKAFLSILNSMNSMVSGKGDAIGGKGSMDRAQASFDDQLALWRRLGHDKDAGLQKPDPKAPKSSGSKAPKKTAADQFDNDIQSIQDRTAALKEEFNSLGLTYEAQTKRQISLQLEQTALKQVREEARKKGEADWQNAQLTPDQIKKIDEVSAAYARQADQLKKAQEAQQLQRDILQGVFDDLKTSLESGKLNWQTFGNIALNVLDKIINKIETDLIDSIMQANNAGGGGSVFGAILGLLTGSGGSSSIFPSAPLGGGGSIGGLWADGGYTGPGGKNQPAGIVHKGEYVFDQDAVKRIGVGNLAMLQRGYANGGLVGGPNLPRINPPSGGGSPAYQDNRQITIDARGAQQGVGEQIKAALTEYDRHSIPRTITAIRVAKQRGMA